MTVAHHQASDIALTLEACPQRTFVLVSFSPRASNRQISDVISQVFRGHLTARPVDTFKTTHLSTFECIDAIESNFLFSYADIVSIDDLYRPDYFFRTAIWKYYTRKDGKENSHPDILRPMNTLQEIYRLTAARGHYRWAIANRVVATICVVFAAYLFVHGGSIGGFAIILVSCVAVLNAVDHERKAKSLKG